MKGQPINSATRAELLALINWIPGNHYLPNFMRDVEWELRRMRESFWLDEMDAALEAMNGGDHESWLRAQARFTKANKALGRLQDHDAISTEAVIANDRGDSLPLRKETNG